MRFNWASGLVLAFAATEAMGATNWFSKAGSNLQYENAGLQQHAPGSDTDEAPSAYNRWHETELERWLSDHCIPYPTPADRKALETLVKANWQAKVQVPLAHASESGGEYLRNVRDWIFDSWSEFQLKAFLNRHGIPNPQPQHPVTLLQAARENYENITKKLGETANYPGNWLYEQWSDSDLNQWLEERGWPVPHPTTRDKLIAAVRRQSYLASLAARNAISSASASASSAQTTLSEALLNAWSDSELKKFLDGHGVRIPQGSTRNELAALARKHRASLVGGILTASSSATSIIGAATSRASNEYARASWDAQQKAEDAFDSAVQKWSDSRLKGFLDARGIPVPHGGKREELLAKVRLYKNKPSKTHSPWIFDTWGIENLRNYLMSMNNKIVNRVGATREELTRNAQDTYSKASKAGDSSYASVTSYLAQATSAVKDTTFDTWSRLELKNYLDSYGLPTPPGSSISELREAAGRNARYFHYGVTTSHRNPIFARIKQGTWWLLDQLRIGASSGRGYGGSAADVVKGTAAQATSRIREEL